MLSDCNERERTYSINNLMFMEQELFNKVENTQTSQGNNLH